MADRLTDHDWSDMRASVVYCHDCRRPTVHLTVPNGVPICSACGYNPMFDQIEDQTEEPPPSRLRFLRRRNTQ